MAQWRNSGHPWTENPKVPPPPTISPFRSHQHVLWSASGVGGVVVARQVGRKRFAPDPADPEMDTRASQPARSVRAVSISGTFQFWRLQAPTQRSQTSPFWVNPKRSAPDNQDGSDSSFHSTQLVETTTAEFTRSSRRIRCMLALWP